MFRISTKITSFLLSIIALGPVLSVNFALAGAWQADAYTKLRLISMQDKRDNKITLGLHILLAPGWKTYWRAPGEAGAPPIFDWSGSENVAEVKVLWPAPKRFSAFGYDSYGYEKEIVWPVQLTPKDADAPMRAVLAVNYLICKNVCIPKTAALSLDAPDILATDEDASLIKYFAKRVPKSGADAPFRFSHVSVSGKPGEQTLTVKAVTTINFIEPDLMVESVTDFGFGRPQITIAEDRHEAILRLPIIDITGKNRSVVGERLKLTMVQGSLSSEQDIAVSR